MGLLTTLGKGQGYLKAGFLGFQASGKTYTAERLAVGLRTYAKLTGPIAMFDTEGGSEYIAERVKKETGLDMLGVKSQSFQDLLDMSVECVKANVSVLIVDSVTHVWRELCDSYLDHVNTMLQKRNLPPRKKLEFQDWNPIKRKWAEWTVFYLNAPLHIIICGRAGFIYEMELNQETNKKELVTTGVKMKTENEFGFEPALLIEMERLQVPLREGGFKTVHHATVVKDRFDVMDGMEVDDPGFDFFLPHIARLTPGANAPIDVTSHTPMHVDEIGQDDYQRRKIRQQKAWEEVDNGLAIIYPGSVGKDKQIKLTILQELTGSASELKIQSLPPEQLEHMALAVREFGRDVLAGLPIEKPAVYIHTIYDRLIMEGAGLDSTRREDGAGMVSTPSDSQQASEAHAPVSHLNLDAEIEQQDLEREYRARFEKAFGTAANPIYKELLADARVTAHTRNQLYGEYTKALKTQQVKA